MSLYLKYRPTELAEVKGNTIVVKSLEGMLGDPATCPHSFLLYGPTGCGKTTLGRIIADMLGCKGNDYHEVDSADFRGIDTVREIRKNAGFLPMEGDVRVWMIDECHKMTNDAQNALLKILEDTPEHVYFILCTTDPQKLLPTVKGRCTQFQLLPLNEAQMLGLLRRIAKAEGQTLEQEVFDQIIKSSNGLPRNAIQNLEQVLNVDAEKQMEIAKKAEMTENLSIDLCRALIKRASWKEVAGILTGLKDQEPESIRRSVLGYCQAILLNGKDEALCGLIMEMFLDNTYDSGFPQLTFACYTITKNK